MRIAQVAPLWLSIPPQRYGGAEQIISLITEGLVADGHEVTLFAPGDSRTTGHLFSVIKGAPGLDKTKTADFSNNMFHLYNNFSVLEKSGDFDIVHWHISKDIIPIMLASFSKAPSVITIHNHFYDFEMKTIKPILEHYKKVKHFISISNAHRKLFPFEYFETVYNGINLDLFEFNDMPQDYFVWVGRFEYHKGLHIAIQAALKLKFRLKIAAPIDENQYYLDKIKPYLNNELIDYEGEIGPAKRNDLLKNAKAFLNPICWDEPFGLVVPEANACGTPVIAFSRGSMSELIKEGENGLLVEADNDKSFMEAIKKIQSMDKLQYRDMRSKCRKIVEDKFTVKEMVKNYEDVYRRIIQEEGHGQQSI